MTVVIKFGEISTRDYQYSCYKDTLCFKTWISALTLINVLSMIESIPYKLGSWNYTLRLSVV